MMGEYEDGCVIGRSVAPPSFPTLIEPCTAHRSKHIPPDNPSTDIVEATRNQVIVDTGNSTVLALHSVKRTRLEHPVVQCEPAHPQWIFETLIRTGSITVD